MKNTSAQTMLSSKNSIQPLVITPSPIAGESLPGFILRTTELNGYGSPIKLLHYAGMDDNEARSARPPLDKLAAIFGKTAAQFKETGLDGTESHQSRRYLQLKGQLIPCMFTRTKHAGVCLECVKEHGFIEAFQELKYALACPKHQVKVISHCHRCHKVLAWHRQGLTKCSCGADLSEALPEPYTDHEVLAVLDILRAKLIQQSLNHEQMVACGFPIAAIEQLSIQTLLSVIYRFGLFNTKKSVQVNDNPIDTDWEALKTTANVLSNWPHRFHDYLEQVHVPNANLKVSGLRGQFNSFYESFFKNIKQDQELQFMREAFISFGQERWKQAAIHPQFAPNAAAKVVGIYGLAKAMHIRPSTARRLVTKGLVKMQNSESSHARELFDVTQQQSFEFAKGKSLSLKTAAQILDIPVDVLRAYRARGHYQARYLAVPTVLYHERDVDALHQALMHDCKWCQVFVNKQHLTLNQIMRMKTSAEIKAAFIAAVKDRTIIPIGKLSELASGLVFDKASVNHYLDKLKNLFKGGMSFEEVESTLKVDRTVLLALIKADVLRYRYQTCGVRILEESFHTFTEQYISCKEVAHIKAMSQNALIELCHALGVSIYQLSPTKYLKQSPMWVERCQLALLGVYNDQERYAIAA
jgi:hypothetical protein